MSARRRGSGPPPVPTAAAPESTPGRVYAGAVDQSYDPVAMGTERLQQLQHARIVTTLLATTSGASPCTSLSRLA